MVLLPTTEGDATWAVTAGSYGVYFAPGPGKLASAPPDVEIGAILPDGSEMRPTVQIASQEGDIGGYVFDPPLPDGSVVYMNGAVFHTVSPPKRQPTIQSGTFR